MTKFKNKFRIPSARAYFWNYSWCAVYFVTICTYNRVHWFGDIVNAKMNLSSIGQIVKSEWLKTFEMRPDMNLSMGEYVVMPNHFHAIIGIGKNEFNNSKRILVDGDVTKNARMIHPDFQWQSRYHDHIIRNDQSFQRISNYSIDNPVRWQKNQFFKSE